MKLLKKALAILLCIAVLLIATPTADARIYVNGIETEDLQDG